LQDALEHLLSYTTLLSTLPSDFNERRKQDKDWDQYLYDRTGHLSQQERQKAEARLTTARGHLLEAEKLLRGGQEMADVLPRFQEWLRPEWQQGGSLLRPAVRLNEVNRQLPMGLDGFEYVQAASLLEKGQKPRDVVRTLRKQRERQEVKYNLERVKGYLDRPLTDAEEKKARTQLEKRTEVAEVVAGLSAALAPERQTDPGGIRLAVQLDEVAAEMEPGLDGREYLQARALLQQNARPAEVVMRLASQRAENFEKLVEERHKEVHGRLRAYGNGLDSLPEPIREVVLKGAREMLHRGSTVEEVVRVYSRAQEDVRPMLNAYSVEDVLRMLPHPTEQ
jgi:hypothetical protein